MERASSANADGDNFDVRFLGAVGLECWSERFIDVIDVIDNCLYVAVGGGFEFDDLDMPLATICEILNEFSLSVKGIPDRPDEVQFMMFGFMLWVKDVVGYRFGLVRAL